MTELIDETTKDEPGTEQLPRARLALRSGLERRGRMWLIWSFLLCPCHLPLSLGVLTALLAGTSVGAIMRDHAWVAGTLITLTWVLGTGYGFHLIRQAQRAQGACPLPQP